MEKEKQEPTSVPNNKTEAYEIVKQVEEHLPYSESPEGGLAS